MFYFDDYWRVWVRRLLNLKGRGIKIDVTIIPRDDTGWAEVLESRIRVHSTADKAPMRDELPGDLVVQLREKVGEHIAEHLLQFNYIKFYGLPQILAADKAWVEGGGFPINRIEELAPVKFLLKEDSWELRSWNQNECQVVSLVDDEYPFGVLDHSIQTLVAKGYSSRQCQEWVSGDV